MCFHFAGLLFNPIATQKTLILNYFQNHFFMFFFLHFHFLEYLHVVIMIRLQLGKDWDYD